MSLPARQTPVQFSSLVGVTNDPDIYAPYRSTTHVAPDPNPDPDGTLQLETPDSPLRDRTHEPPSGAWPRPRNLTMALKSYNTGGGGGGGGGYGSYAAAHRRSDSDATSVLDDVRALLARAARALVRWWHERGRQMAVDQAVRSARRLRLNLVPHRVVSVPHLLVAAWVLVLLRGERWVFGWAVEECRWEGWERWVSGDWYWWCWGVVLTVYSLKVRSLIGWCWWRIRRLLIRIRIRGGRGR